MKKIVFSIVGSMLLSLCVVQAQERNDTTGTASKTKQQKSQTYEKSRQKSDRTRHQGDDQAWQQQSDRNQYSSDYANEGMVVIDKNEMPPALKQTLQQKKYAGWENGTIYHNTNTGEYVIAPRAYRFDKQGKEMEMGNSQAYGNREGRQGRYSSGDRNAQYPSRTKESQKDQSQSQQDQRTQSQQDQRTQAQQDQSSQSSQNESAQGQPLDRNQTPSSSQDQDNADQSDNAQSSQTQRSGNDDQQSAQQPSSSYRTDRNSQSDANTQSSTRTQSQAEQPSQSQYRTEDMVEVQAEQIPASLRRTLGESKYKGWEENGTLYQDPSTSEYVLEMESTNTNDASQPRAYRFDKNGQLKPEQNGTGNNDQ